MNTSYSYDSVSHLLSVLHQAGNTTLDGAGYTYDPAGNRQSKTNYLNGVTSNYGYDALYELTQVTQGTSTTESYSYDAVGNRLSSSGVPNYNYNSSNELTSNSNGSYSYDANGNTLTDAQGRSFTWDFENRLTQAVVPGTNGGTTTFKYDPFGRRIEKISPTFTSVFVYDGTNLIETANASGAEVASYTRTQEIDEALAELRGSATDYYEVDALGSVTSLSNSTAALANTYTYDSFGNLTASTGTARNYFQYTGREFDPETGLNFYRARYYDQQTGRFTSEDPIGFSGSGPNFYGYVSNNPVLFADPLGLCPTNTAEQEACRWRVAMWHLKREMEINNETDKKLLDEIFTSENVIGFSVPEVAEPVVEHYGWELAKKFLPPVVEVAHMSDLSYKLWLISDEGMNEKHDLDVLFKTLLYQCDH